DNTAFQPTDYANTSGNLTFNPGETSKSINVAVASPQFTQFNVVDQTFYVNLGSPVGATIGMGGSQATAVILHDSVPSLWIDGQNGPPNIWIDSPTVGEGVAGG